MAAAVTNVAHLQHDVSPSSRSELQESPRYASLALRARQIVSRKAALSLSECSSRWMSCDAYVAWLL
jgi:hypothetical protein